MKHHTQLTRDQRYQMYGLLEAQIMQKDIAEQLHVHKSTISRELKRNKGLRGWRPKQAHEKASTRKEYDHRSVKFGDVDWELIAELLRRDYSPEQIAGRLLVEKQLQISHETIYLHVYADKRAGGDLWNHLRCQKKRRKRYGSGQERRGMIKNRVSIDERPKIVELRSRLGDWEGDTIIGHAHKGALLTLVDRKSRYTLVGKLLGKEASGVKTKVTEKLDAHSGKRYSITFDNGKEFAEHEAISAALGTDIYFAHPYHSWERGLNENTNGLLRQYFPKGMNLLEVSDTQVQDAENQLNHRPRKILGFKSPYEVHFQETLRYCLKI